MIMNLKKIMIAIRFLKILKSKMMYFDNGNALERLKMKKTQLLRESMRFMMTIEKILVRDKKKSIES